jgi:glycosyltransferase involved in cell wall biosynthesis
MISDVFFPRVNGVSTSIETFRRELDGLGHTTHLVAPAYPADGPPHPGVTRVPSRHVPFDPEDRLMRGRALLGLTESLRSERFDLMHIQTPFVAHRIGVKLADRLGLARVETFHTHFEEYFHHYVPLAPRRLLRAIARRMTVAQSKSIDALVVPSRAMHDLLRGYGVRTKTRVIPTGIDDDFFSGGDGKAFREAHGIATDRPVLLHLGRIAHEKNIDFLLHVLCKVRETIPDALLVITGEGPARRHLERMAACLDLESHVRFIDYLSRGVELRNCYCSADAFVFASRTETQGLVLLEAMALGIPVVSTAVLGTRDILEDCAGALVAEEDVAEFAAAVARLLGDPSLRKRLSGEAREHARRWSCRAMAERLVELYRDVLADGGPTSGAQAPSRARPI